VANGTSAYATLHRFVVQNGVGSGTLAGGIDNAGSLQLDDCVVQSNAGGGIRNGERTSLTLNRTIVRGNVNTSAGAGVDNQAEAYLRVSASTISGNHAGSVGGGIRHAGYALTISNSTISGNSADVGAGAIHVEPDLARRHPWNRVLVSITHSTITENVSGAAGGALYGPAPVIEMGSTILSGNPGGDCSGLVMTSTGYNFTDAPVCGLGGGGTDLIGSLFNPPLQAKLGPLADNGGPTPTHALLPGSAALDSGDNATCASVDQRGRFRPVDGDGNGSAVCDRGAVEQGASPLVGLSVADLGVTEGDGAVATFTVSLSAPSSRVVTVYAATSDGTATAGLDYVPFADWLSFPPGVTQRTVDVTILGDRIHEPVESFSMVLTHPIDATVTRAVGQATIVDDDPPGISIAGPAVLEPSAGETLAVFTVTLSPPSAAAVSVDFTTSDGTATAPEDYQHLAGTLTFDPGTTTRTIGVVVEADSVRESLETFHVTLSNPTGGARIAARQATATIAEPGGFHTLTPCRLLDTRNPDSPYGGPYIATASWLPDRKISAIGRCGIPATARVLALNVTVTQPYALGNLTLYAAGSLVPNTTTINFAAGATRGNNALVSLSPAGELAIHVSTWTATHVILDVTGYFELPAADANSVQTEHLRQHLK
jgi:hypothetical protein